VEDLVGGVDGEAADDAEVGAAGPGGAGGGGEALLEGGAGAGNGLVERKVT
jgi:hypothetical protein